MSGGPPEGVCIDNGGMDMHMERDIYVKQRVGPVVDLLANAVDDVC
jgi:hypothetical protein